MVSVAVINWNGKRYLKECLDSLCAQTFRDFTIYLVDNASNDGSVEFVKFNYPEVRVISLPRNLGFVGAANAAFRECSGEYIALLNNDTRVDPEWLQELYRGIHTGENTGICASKMLFFHEPEILNAAGDVYRTDGTANNRGIGEKDEGQYEAGEYVFGACAGGALYRRSMLDEIGLFDEDYFAFMEDADLSFRAQLAGHHCYYNPKAVLYHVHMGTIGKNSPDHLRYIVRNRIFTLLKNMPGRLLARHAFWILTTAVVEFFSIVLNPRKGWSLKKAYFLALAEVARGTPKFLKKRRLVQSTKKVTDTYIASILTPMGFSRYGAIIGRFRRGGRRHEKQG